MERTAIIALIRDIVRQYLTELEEKHIPDIVESTALFGEQAILDSVGLVSVILEVESQLDERHGISVTVANERAMSQSKSPFITVGAVADYVVQLIEEQG